MSCSSFPSDGVWNVAQYGRGAASNRHLDLVNWLTEFSRHQQTRHSPATKSTKPRTSKWTSQKGRRNQQTFSKRNIRRSFHRNHLRRVYGPLSTRKKKNCRSNYLLNYKNSLLTVFKGIFLLRGHSKIVRMFSQKFVFFFSFLLVRAGSPSWNKASRIIDFPLLTGWHLPIAALCIHVRNNKRRPSQTF
jgi:hypothetical protein